MPAVMNILLALRERERTGQGTRLDIAMADAMFTFAWYGLAQGHATGQFPGARGTPADGREPPVPAIRHTRWHGFSPSARWRTSSGPSFCEAIGLPGELRDDRKAPHATRAALKAIIGAHPAPYWRQLLEPLDCCCTIVASLEEALADRISSNAACSTLRPRCPA